MYGKYMVELNSETKIRDKSIKNGILAGVMLNANFLACAISNVISISNIYVYLLALMALVAIIINGLKIPILKAHYIVVAVVIIQLLLGKAFINSPMTNQFILSFVGVGLPCLIITFYRIDLDALLKTIVVSSVIGIPYYLILFRTTYTVYNAGTQMGIAYSILPGVAASIILFFNCNSFFYKVFSILIALINILILFRLMTRGAYLCIFIFVIGYIYLMNQDKRSKKLIINLGLILLAGLFLYFFGERIATTTWFYRIFGTKEGNILNGRERDLEVAFSWRGFDKFFFGAGVGSFQKNEYTEYIHNVLGQTYYEQGIYSVLFVVFIILRTIKIFFKEQLASKGVKVFLLMLFCIGIVRLMVSYYFWIDQYFWLFIWVILGYRYKTVFADREEGKNNGAC